MIAKNSLTYLLAVLIAVGNSSIASAQTGVRFMTGSLEGVKSVARDKNMNLLIDTYASWCIPCKRMDKVFAQKDVGDFFNEHYIPYKVNMDGPYGEAVKAEFQVVFLPTLIIVGPDGTIKYKVDREMSASELLSVGRLALQEGIQIASDATAVRKNGEAPPKKTAPTSQKRQKKNSTPSSTNDKIVYVMGLDGLESPDEQYLRKEAYFRLELMDGSHTLAAQKYLETQTNWNTKENMRFILDFVSVPMSPMYNHIIEHKQAYYEAFTKEQVDHALQILVYKHLFKGIPRPTMEKATQLYADLGYPDPHIHAENYMIVRYRADRQHQEAYEMSYHYLTETNPEDEVALGKFYDYLLSNAHEFDAEDLLKAVDLIDRAAITGSQRLTLEPKAIKLYLEAGECESAKKRMKAVQRTIKESNTNLPELKSISINCGA